MFAKQVSSFLKSHDVIHLKGISTNFLKVLEDIDNHYPTVQKASVQKGRICETVFKLALYFRIEIPGVPRKLSLYENGQKCYKMSEISFGVKSGGCDITAIGEDTIAAGTSKLKHLHGGGKTQWGQIDWRSVILDGGLLEKYRNFHQIFIAVVGNKNDIEDKAVPSLIREKFPGDRCLIVDIGDLTNIWSKILDKCHSHNWNTAEIDEVVKDRKHLELMPHQSDCVSKAIQFVKENKSGNFLIADKPRAGKTIMFAEIIRSMWNEKIGV
jgi:hypothetical protein